MTDQHADYVAQYRASLVAEIEMAVASENRVGAAVSGFSWFAWGLRRALALLDYGPEAEDFSGVTTTPLLPRPAIRCQECGSWNSYEMGDVVNGKCSYCAAVLPDPNELVPFEKHEPGARIDGDAHA